MHRKCFYVLESGIQEETNANWRNSDFWLFGLQVQPGAEVQVKLVIPWSSLELIHDLLRAVHVLPTLD